MNKKIFLLILLSLSCMVTACQKEEKADKEEQGLKKQSLDTIWNQWGDTIKNCDKNIVFDGKIQCEKPEEVAVNLLVQVDAILEKKEQIRKMYVPDKQFDRKYYKENPNTVPEGPEYINEKTGQMWLIGNNGFLNYSNHSDDQNYDGDAVEKTVFVNRSFQDETVELKDGKIALSQAIAMAQKEEDKWREVTGDVCEARPKKIEILPSAKGGKEKALCIYFEKSYKGVGILTEYRTLETSADKPLSVDYIPCYDDVLTITSVKNVERILSNAGAVKCEKVERKLDKIISLESAIQIMEKELAQYHEFTISHIELCYRYLNDKGEKCLHEAGDEYRTSPCWVFRLNEEKNKEEFVLVDCETGKMDYVKNY